MQGKVAVSILVPVYNSEKYIRRFLESALSQSLDDIEVICIDNQSDDRTGEIINEYRAIFPDKLFLYSTDQHYDTCAPGRNLALKYAKGKYVFLCDSDDMIPPYAMEQLYTEAARYDSELVCGWGKLVMEDEKGNTRLLDACKKNTQAASNETAIISGCEWWLRLIKKSLIEKVGAIPTEYVFDDAAYLPVLQSFAHNIRFIDAIVYYYFKRSDSLCGLRYETCSTSVKAEKYALENCNPKYLNAVQCMVAIRTKSNLENRWPFFDIFVSWAKEQMEWLPQNRLVTKNKALFSKLKWAAELAYDVLPNRVYVDGFKKGFSEERSAILKIQTFNNDCDLIVLSEDNCDITSNEYVKEAYNKGKHELVAHYFALKNIYERGGVFIHDRIKILNHFFYYKYHNAFFSLIDKNTYSDSIFGAPSENEAIADLLNTFSWKWDKQGKYQSLSERIKIILTAKYGIPLDGKERLFQWPVSVISPNLSVVDTRFGSVIRRVICEHDFSDYAKHEEYITIKRSSLETIMNNEKLLVNASSTQASTSTKTNLYGTGQAVLPQSTQPAVKTERERALEHELLEIKQSNLWKIMLRLKKIGDGPRGPFLKRIFHRLIKIQMKFKKTY